MITLHILNISVSSVSYIIVVIIWQGRILQSDWSISGPDFAVMPSAAVAGHYDIFNALQNKTEQNSENTTLFLRNVNRCKNERRQTLRANKFYYFSGYIVQF